MRYRIRKTGRTWKLYHFHGRPRWVDGELKPNDVWVYRLGDVRDYALRAETKRNKVPA